MDSTDEGYNLIETLEYIVENAETIEEYNNSLIAVLALLNEGLFKGVVN